MFDKEAIEEKLREYKPILEHQYCVKKIGVLDRMPVMNKKITAILT